MAAAAALACVAMACLPSAAQTLPAGAAQLLQSAGGLGALGLGGGLQGLAGAGLPPVSYKPEIPNWPDLGANDGQNAPATSESAQGKQTRKPRPPTQF